MSVIDKLMIYTLKGDTSIPLVDVYDLNKGKYDLNDYDIKDFLTLCPEFKDIFDSNEKNRYNIMFTMYCNLGKDTITSEYGDNAIYCLTWYIAHHLQIAISNAKNNNNVANLNSTNLPKNMTNNNGETKDKSRVEGSLARDLCRTTYGQNLYEIMKIVGKTSIMGVY